MMMEKTKKSKLTVPQTLVLGVLGSILIGAILLKLPMSNCNGKSISVIDTLFTATSAVCVTGLNTIVPAQQFTTFGKVVLMCLIEVGGIGFMSFIALILMIMKRKISFSERILIKESLNQNNEKGIIKLIKKVFIYIGIIEIIGAIILSIRFIPEYGAKTGIFYSIFHSISAVCNAGFDIIGNSSLIKYQYDGLVSITIMFLIIIGGLGYTVWSDLVDTIKKIFKSKIKITKACSELSTHTKIVLTTTLILIISGAMFTFFLEKDNVQIMKSDNVAQKILKSSFYSVTLRTAGFETIDSTELTTATKFISLIYMFIGGSSGSTAGGVKTTTFAIIILMVISYLKGQENTVVYKRTIPQKVLKRAIVIVSVSIFIVIASIMGLAITEDLRAEQQLPSSEMIEREIEFLDIFYEVFSAFGTVGLTTGITTKLSKLGKVIIMLLMFIGRLGPITISYAVLKKHNTQKNINYPESDLLVG
ncbi:MAG: Trk family potassium uptake protein [Clostridia bacterium]|nr:Trk family potassium uptake protein [Clostridia bacterium]